MNDAKTANKNIEQEETNGEKQKNKKERRLEEYKQKQQKKKEEKEVVKETRKMEKQKKPKQEVKKQEVQQQEHLSISEMPNHMRERNEERKKQTALNKKEREAVSKKRIEDNKRQREEKKQARQSLLLQDKINRQAKKVTNPDVKQETRKEEDSNGKVISRSKEGEEHKSLSFENMDGNKANGKAIIKKGDKTIEMNLINNKPDGDITIIKQNSKIIMKQHPTLLEPQVVIEKYDKTNLLIQVTEIFRLKDNKANGRVTIRDITNQKETHCHALDGEISGHVQQANPKGNITCNIENGKKQGEAVLIQHRNNQTTKATFKDDKFVGKVVMQTKNTKQTFKTSKGKLKKPVLYFLQLPWLLVQTIFNMIKRVIFNILKAIFYLITWPYQLYKLYKLMWEKAWNKK